MRVPTPASAPCPLLLLPGLACDAALWRHQVSALAAPAAAAAPATRRPVRVTDVHHRASSLPAMAALLLAEQPGPLLLAGCSLGGMVALEAARQAPGRIRGLALLGTTARPDTPESIKLRTQAIALIAQGRAEELLRVNAMVAFHPRHAAALLEDYVAMVLRAGTPSLIRQNQAVMARVDLRPCLGAIRCPTLVVGGLADPLTPPDHARELAATIPGAQLQLLADCGHMLTWEQPDAVNALLLDWLAGLG